jgi:uncharacterized membrane protein
MNKTALLSIAGALAGAVAMAQSATPARAADGVKCYGISMAGKNDCANQAAGHSCAGQSKVDYDGADYKVVKDQAACMAEQGKTMPFTGPNPAKKA